MTPETVAALEALLFASDSALPLSRIAEVLELDPAAAGEAVEALRRACEAADRGLALVEIGGGFRLVTRPELAPVLLRLQRLRLRSRLSRAAVETLAIIAYRQPISRPEVEQLRGVGAESVITHLLERRLIRVVGRKATPGRPILYGTTREFLEHFGLRDLGELPPFEVAETAPAPPAALGEAAPGGGAPDEGALDDGAADGTPAAVAAAEGEGTAAEA